MSEENSFKSTASDEFRNQTPADAQNTANDTPADPKTAKSPDPHDLDTLWAPVPLVQTRTQILTIRASTRPPKDKFIRVLPFEMGETGDVHGYVNCRPVYLFGYQFEGDLSEKTFYVRPNTEVAAMLTERDRLKNAILVLGVARHGSHFVWELKLPNGSNESGDKWAQSRIDIAKTAETKWIKPVAKMSAGGYDYDEPIAQYDDPDWSLIAFDEMIKAACNDRVIESSDHEAVVEALGL